MRIRLDDVRREPFSWSESVEIAAESLQREELAALSPVAWRGRITYADPGFHLRARAKYEQTLRCDRCLGEYTEPVESELELMVLEHTEREEEEGERELSEEDLGLVYAEGGVLDTRPMLVEQLQLNVPMRPLCREACQGLCPVCGANRNAQECDCKVETVDPRWAGLAELRSRLTED
jgi:uncharacterized protein